MMKKFMLLICACVSGVMVHADSYPYLTFQNADGTMTSVGVESLMMTISDGKLIVTNANESKELSLADLSSMYFSMNDATGISDAKMSDANKEVEAFSLQGVSVGKFTSIQSLKESLSSGVYIVKSDNKTIKITVK